MAERPAGPRARLRAALARRARDEEGTVLVMVPAGLLVMILLGAMAFDLSLAFAGERRVADLAASWANDAATQVSDATFYGTSESQVRLDPLRVEQVVLAARAGLVDPGLEDLVAEATVLPDGVSVEVRVAARVPFLFLDAVPGMRFREVDATSVATLVVGG